MGLGCDPLGLKSTVSNHQGDNDWTGNATGNPTRVVFRQIMTDAAEGLSQEVLKDELDKKHKLTFSLTNADFTLDLEMDMRNSMFIDNPVTTGVDESMGLPLTVTSTVGLGPGNFVNKITFNSVDANFDMAKTGSGGVETSEVNVTAGRYSFTPGAGWKTSGDPDYWNTYYAGTGADPGDFYLGTTGVPIYDKGTYTFIEGNYDAFAEDYGSYMDPGQNPCGGDPFC